MRTQDQNPAFQRFKGLLPRSGRYPARWVDIFSNTDDELRYYDVEVVFLPRESEATLDRDFWDEFAAYNEQWIADLGNSVAGWMEPGGLTPEHVFGIMLHRGFVNHAELELAISEFAHIEECSWARDMQSKGLLAKALRKGASNREKIIEALEDLVDRPNADWAGRMLSMVVDDDDGDGNDGEYS